MDSTREGHSVVYVTLVEAAEEIGGSAEDLRRALKNQRIKGVKENPENKRSRWLVPLEDVRNLYETEAPAEAPEIDTADGSETVTNEVTASEPDSVPVEAALDLVENRLDPASADHSHGSSASIASVVPARGEELIERLASAIDRFSDSVPEAPFDYQALLDKYVVAVEEKAEAEVGVATLRRRIDDLNEQTANGLEELKRIQVQNRQLLTELELSRAELKTAANRSPAEEARPLWKRRSRQ